jgi:cytochrome P450
MATNPDVQKKAQEEIDACVGDDRLPNYNDWPSLPYIEAVVREIFRWRNVLPLSLPHCATEDDIYKGYFIPKGESLMN